MQHKQYECTVQIECSLIKLELSRLFWPGDTGWACWLVTKTVPAGRQVTTARCIKSDFAVVNKGVIAGFGRVIPLQIL